MRSRRTFESAAVTMAAALCALPFLAIEAQKPAAPADSAANAPDAPATHSRVSLTGTNRSYRIGDSSVSERVANATLELFGPRVHLRLDGTFLRFTAPADMIVGTLPIRLRLDFSTRPGDTLSAFVRSASRPFDLTSSQTAALSTAGTSTVDVESAGLGTPAVGGVRAAFAYPIGDMVLALRGGVETEPRPDGAAPAYWRGTTLRGGLALTSSAGDGSITASLDVARSSADSMGGRNLFPGGGNVTLTVQSDLSVANPFDPLEDETWPLRTVAFIGRPFGNDRADQPNLLIPQGTLIGLLSTLVIPVGDLTFAPSVQVLRETSEGTSSAGALTNKSTGSAWTALGALDVTIPLGDRFELTPQAGFALGNVGATFSQSAVIRRGRVSRTSAFNDAIRGAVLSLQLTADF